MAGGARAGLTCRVSRMGPRMSITSPRRITNLGSLFRNFSAVILEPAGSALGALARGGTGVTGDGGGGHLEPVPHSCPAAWLGLRAKLTWGLHPVHGLANPLPAHHAALTWEQFQPILRVDLIAQITDLARRKGESGGPRPSALGSTPTLARPEHTPPPPGTGSRDGLVQSPFYG